MSAALTRDGCEVAVDVWAQPNQPVSVSLVVHGARPGCAPSFLLDENHAAALVLALQAAIAGIQARAVSR